jgi:prevent-host-death family protein
MEYVTAKEFQNNFGEYSLKAERKPVAITKHGKTRLIVISIEDFMQILKSTQKSLHVSELSAEQIDSIRNAKAPEENDFLNKLLEE